MLEGVSFLALLAVAMPLKYVWGMPLAVKLVGWAHGLLFVLFLLLVRPAIHQARWPFWRGLILVGAALVPFGPFLADPSLRSRQRAITDAKN
jgi:integral membrane protein